MRKIFNLIIALVCLACLSAVVFTEKASAQKKTVKKPPVATQLPSRIPVPAATFTDDDTMTMIRRKNRLDVGVSTFVPWAMHDKNGELIGFEIEVAKKLAEDLGVELKLHPVGFNEIVGDLVNKRFDIIVTGIYPTPQRVLFVNFSEPYSESKIELVASRDKMRRANERKDFDKSDVTIGVVKGTVYSD